MAPATPVPSTDAGLVAAYGGLLRRLYAWATAPVSFPPETGDKLRALAEQGTVVYVGRSSALVTFLFFQHLFLRVGAPIADAVVGLGATLRAPWWRLIAGRRSVRAPFGEDVVGATRAGRSSLVFLRKPGSLVATVLGLKDPFPGLVAAQRTLDKPILLVPELLIWPRAPGHLQKSVFDVLFGEPEAPGFWRSTLSFVWNRRRAFVKLGEPVNLKEAIARFGELDDATIARKVRGALYQHLSREARVVTGPPMKSAERLVLETMRDRTLRGTLAEVARERGRADTSVEKEALKDLREIAARFSPSVVGLVKILMDWIFNRIYDGVDIDDEGIQRVARTAAKTPIVVCPSHKSHIDYLVMSTVFYGKGLIPPHIAAGINLSFFPLGPIFRRCGAFFIRRSFKGDRVYGAVLKAYVRKLVKDGWSQEFFVEGTRSRTGKVLMPKYGMLSMEVDAWIDGVRPDIAFVPSWIGYAKIIEAKSYAHELSGGEKKPEDLGALLRAPQVLASRYGRVYIRFDEPISLAELAERRGFDRTTHTEDDKRALVRALGFRIVEGINRVTSLTATGLLSTVLLSHDRRGLTAPELVARMGFLLKLARDQGGTTSFPADAPGALDPLQPGPMHEARGLLEKDRALTVHETGGEHIFALEEDERVGLDYQKNTALHFFVADALLATALLTGDDRTSQRVQARTLALSRAFKQEFIYGGEPFPVLFARRVARFSELGLVEVVDGRIEPLDGGAPQLRQLADLLVNFVEAYMAANDALNLLLAGPMDRKEFYAKAIERARASYLAGRLRRIESISKAILENAVDLFMEQQVVVRHGDKGRQLALTDAHRSPEAIAKRVDELRGFLIEKGE